MLPPEGHHKYAEFGFVVVDRDQYYHRQRARPRSLPTGELAIGEVRCSPVFNPVMLVRPHLHTRLAVHASLTHTRIL
jgi:hypothetical protein